MRASTSIWVNVFIGAHLGRRKRTFLEGKVVTEGLWEPSADQEVATFTPSRVPSAPNRRSVKNSFKRCRNFLTSSSSSGVGGGLLKLEVSCGAIHSLSRMNEPADPKGTQGKVSGTTQHISRIIYLCFVNGLKRRRVKEHRTWRKEFNAGPR
ncbi:hypothetical protein DL96DRAFT_541952 [Flagelloscypha sp. PMI_526]|nr:hypothetical protein DL96DRAFT_541952 [Flagelloscypha sp. PMI_526]